MPVTHFLSSLDSRAFVPQRSCLPNVPSTLSSWLQKASRQLIKSRDLLKQKLSLRRTDPLRLLRREYWESFLVKAILKPASELQTTLSPAAVRSDSYIDVTLAHRKPVGQWVALLNTRGESTAHSGGQSARCEGIWRSVRRNREGWSAIAASGLIL